MKKEYLELIAEIANSSNWSASEKETLHKEISYKSKKIEDVINYYFPFALIKILYLENTEEEIEAGITDDFLGASYYFLNFKEDDFLLRIYIIERTIKDSIFEKEKDGLYNIDLNTLYDFIESMQKLKNDVSIKIPKNNSQEQIENRNRKVDELISKF